VTLVLDGKLGTSLPTGVRKPTDMVVSYATADQTADSIIERLVGASGVANEILVITADEAEKLTVESLGAATASPSWLRKELEIEETSFTDELDRVHRSARWK
jgi:predicted RNA-binding protein with PIN domain